jgi:hypothetical protein
MFHTADILSKLRAQGAPAAFLKTALEELSCQGLETRQPYLLIGPGHVRTSDSGLLHQGSHDYYVLPLSLVPVSVSAASRRAA